MKYTIKIPAFDVVVETGDGVAPFPVDPPVIGPPMPVSSVIAKDGTTWFEPLNFGLIEQHYGFPVDPFDRDKYERGLRDAWHIIEDMDNRKG